MGKKRIYLTNDQIKEIQNHPLNSEHTKEADTEQAKQFGIPLKKLIRWKYRDPKKKGRGRQPHLDEADENQVFINLQNQYLDCCLHYILIGCHGTNILQEFIREYLKVFKKKDKKVSYRYTLEIREKLKNKYNSLNNRISIDPPQFSQSILQEESSQPNSHQSLYQSQSYSFQDQNQCYPTNYQNNSNYDNNNFNCQSIYQNDSIFNQNQYSNHYSDNQNMMIDNQIFDQQQESTNLDDLSQKSQKTHQCPKKFQFKDNKNEICQQPPLQQKNIVSDIYYYPEKTLTNEEHQYYLDVYGMNNNIPQFEN